MWVRAIERHSGGKPWANIIAFPEERAQGRGDRVFRFNTYVTEKGTVGSSPWNFNQRQLLAGVARPPYAALSLGSAVAEFNFPALSTLPPKTSPEPPASSLLLSYNNPQLRVLALLLQEDSLMDKRPMLKENKCFLLPHPLPRGIAPFLSHSQMRRQGWIFRTVPST